MLEVKKILKLVIFRQEKGVTLVETLVALAIMGFIAVGFLSALATGTKASTVADEQTTAESLARSQLEYVKLITYQTGAMNYPVDPGLSIPANWTILPTSVQPLHGSDDGIQKITVTIQHNSHDVFVLKGYKTS